jgi:hypothetical protein
MAGISMNRNPQIMQAVICPQCQRRLEVIWLFPLTLEPAINEKPHEKTPDSELKTSPSDL